MNYKNNKGVWIIMKKLLGIALATIMMSAVFTGCGQKTDWDYISSKKEMTIGITMFAPMNYKGDDGKLTGFETEFSEAVCKELGVTAKFQEINWDSKETELNSKNIDCIWNGMTIDKDRKKNMDISVAYMENKQVMVVKSENLSKYTTADSLKGAKVVAEAQSAGDAVATTDDFFKQATYTAVDSQAKALMEVKSGTADIAVIDYVMSIGSIGEGTDYSDIAVVSEKEFSPEEYGIGFRKNSPETLKKVNDAIQKLADDGTLNTIAKKYKLQDLILVKAK